MYKISISITEPMEGGSVVLTYQFDPTTLDQAKWAAAFPFVRGKVDEMVAWADTPTRFTPIAL